ncbi:hypothetical protein HK102_007563 [Quaeritorhiza haematococci]|nr:hypothetical protein HK102_007563 [Quaeritorhiza haematococci]
MQFTTILAAVQVLLLACTVRVYAQADCGVTQPEFDACLSTQLPTGVPPASCAVNVGNNPAYYACLCKDYQSLNLCYTQYCPTAASLIADARGNLQAFCAQVVTTAATRPATASAAAPTGGANPTGGAAAPTSTAAASGNKTNGAVGGVREGGWVVSSMVVAGVLGSFVVAML